MRTENQERFIRKIRSALGYSPKERERRKSAIFTSAPTPEQQQLLDRIRSRTDADRRDLLAHLTEQGKPLNLKVILKKDAASVASAIAEMVAEKSPEWGDAKSVVQWDHPLVSELNLAAALGEQKVPVHTAAFEGNAERAGQRARLRQQVTDAYIGVTSADFCLADTATLVMKTRPGQARSVSLVPSVHVAVIRLDQLLSDLKELYALLRWDSAQQAEGLTHHMSFISGPSKTADIELTMVHGAHGPRELHLFVITG